MPKITSSEDVANIAQLWEALHIINLDTKTIVGYVTRDISEPNQLLGISEKNRKKLIALFEKAFADKCSHIGFVAPRFLYDTMYTIALDVAEDNGGDWQVSPIEHEEYEDLASKARLKILTQTAIASEREQVKAEVEQIEEEICNLMGLDTQTIVNLYGVLPEQEKDLEELITLYTQAVDEVTITNDERERK